MILYHITPTRNLPKILKEGLPPNSYFSDHLDLENWLSVIKEEKKVPLVILETDVPEHLILEEEAESKSSYIGQEYQVPVRIPPSKLKRYRS